MNILQHISSLSDSSYKEFNAKIIPTHQHVLGVRLPALRKVAKAIMADNPKNFISLNKDNIYEMVMLEGIVLSLLKEEFTHITPLLEQFIDKVDNWAQIDSTIAQCWGVKKDKAAVFHVVKRWLKSEKEFVVRAALVLMIFHFVEDKYIDEVLLLSQAVQHEAYYVYMANAWLVSVCMAKIPDKTLPFFAHNYLDKRTQNKAIQKSRESFRVSPSHKEQLKEFKK